MARVIVMPDGNADLALMNEHVKAEHLNDQHSALQVLERLAWAIEDADRRTGERRKPKPVRRRPSRIP